MKLLTAAKEGAPVLLICVVLALFCHVVVISGGTAIFNLWGNSDQYTYFYPMLKQVFGRLAQGNIPLWNPYQLAGVPLVATGQVSIFYPPNYLHIIFPIEVAMRLFVFMHFILAGALGFALGRALDLDRVPSTFCGVVYGLSGFLVQQFLWPNSMATIAWFPGVFAAVAWIHRGGKRIAVCALAGAVGMLLLAGYIQYAFYSLKALTAFALFNCFRTVFGQGIKAAGREGELLVGGIGLGFALAAPQLLPTIELMHHGVRGPEGLTDAQLEPMGIMPRLFVDHPFNAHLRLSVIAVLLLASGLFCKTVRPQSAFFLGLAVVSYFLAFGSATPLYAVDKVLLGGRLFRAPERYFSIVCLAGAVAAALGAQAVLSRTTERASQYMAISILGTAFFLWLFNVNDNKWILPSAGLLCVAMWVFRRATAAIGLCIIAVAFANQLRTKISDLGIWDRRALELLRQDEASYEKIRLASGFSRVLLRPTRLDQIPALSPKNASLFGFYAFQDYEPLTLRKAADYVTFAQTGKLYDPQAGNAPFSGQFDMTIPISNTKLLAAAGVGAIVTIKDGRSQGARFELESIEGAMPRAYVVSHARAAKDCKSSLSTIASADFDLKSEVLLESMPPDSVKEVAGGTRSDSVVIKLYEPERVSIEATLDRPGYLVVLDADFPGWSAKVNGRPAHIYNANCMFRAVLLDRGVNQVTFRYRPMSFLLGCLLGCAAIVLIFGILFQLWRAGEHRLG